MNKQSPFKINEPVVPPIFAGRENEMAHIFKVLFEEQESLAIFGNDAIGKSSILKTINSHLIINKSTNVLTIGINAFDFKEAVETNFLGLVTHQICASIWTKLMNRNYSELIEDAISNVRGGLIILPEEESIKRIFKIVTSNKLSGVGKFNKEFGGKLFIEGKVSQENSFTSERKPLAPFEFLHLLDELNDIISRYNYTSILVICDEMNHLPYETNTEILRSYFDVFSSRNIQFLLTIVNPSRERENDAKLLLDSFNKPLEIGHFKEIKDVQQLVFNVLSLDEIKIGFDKDAFKTLFEITNGHPWWIQKICDSTYERAISNKCNFIDSLLIEKESQLFLTEMTIYKSQMEKGLHFRKFHLNGR
jgi:energy-coupling factor transporter ATP-binding protein EcfA2